MNKKIILGFLTLLLPTFIFAFAEIKNFEFYKSIGEFYSPGVYYINIDSDIESKSKKYLSDIRIFSPNNNEIKYKIKKEEDIYSHISQDINLPIISKKNNIYIIDLGNDKKDSYLNSIYIKTKEKDFRRVVDVFGADFKNGQYFKLNIEGKRGDLIYNLPQGTDNSINFKYSNYKYLKLVFSGDEGNFSENGFYKVDKKTTVENGEKDFLEINGLENTLTGNNQSIILDTKKDNLFFDQVKLKFSDKRFSRKYILYSSENENAEILESGKRFNPKKDYWVKVSEGNLSKETYTGNPVLNLKNNKRFYRLDILNGDNKSLNFSGAIFEKFKRKIYFKSEKGYSILKLYYSSDKVEKPAYDFVLTDNEITSAKQIYLSEEKINENYIAEEKSIFDDNKWLIYLLVGVVMFVLGFFVYKIVKESGGKTDRDGMQI